MRFKNNLFGGPSRKTFCTLVGAYFIFLIASMHAQQSKTPGPPAPIANFTDVPEKAGLTGQNIFGGIDTKKYIIETTGTGVAIFDYDNDGWPDIFVANGTKLEGFRKGQDPCQPVILKNKEGTLHSVNYKACHT